MTYLIYIVVGGNHSERYVEASSVEAAIASVRASLPKFERRWANVFA